MITEYIQYAKDHEMFLKYFHKRLLTLVKLMYSLNERNVCDHFISTDFFSTDKMKITFNALNGLEVKYGSVLILSLSINSGKHFKMKAYRFILSDNYNLQNLYDVLQSHYQAYNTTAFKYRERGKHIEITHDASRMHIKIQEFMRMGEDELFNRVLEDSNMVLLQILDSGMMTYNRKQLFVRNIILKCKEYSALIDKEMDVLENRIKHITRSLKDDKDYNDEFIKSVI